MVLLIFLSVLYYNDKYCKDMLNLDVQTKSVSDPCQKRDVFSQNKNKKRIRS